jgi:hypothetical protein
MPEFTILQLTPSAVIASVLFFLLLVFYVLGHRFYLFELRKKPELEKANLSTINGMLLGLLGLLLAFSFSMSNSRFDVRRQLVIEETNDIGTVILRSQILSDSMRDVLKPLLRSYVEERIQFYQAGMDLRTVLKHMQKADSLGQVIWKQTAAYAKAEPVNTEVSKIIPALNDMLDITLTRRAAGEATIPDSILYFLFLLCLGSAFLLGYDHRGPVNWTIVLGFALMLSATVFTIMDLDKPRSGLIRMDKPNEKMLELRSLFDNP